MKATLIGAGPGDVELLTLKGLNRLKDADVVLYDRLVSKEILALIPKTAEKIDVGKKVNSHPVPQNEINNLILEKCKENKNVVRLKGGDAFVFGRGGEELELLSEHDVPFEVIPGITSAISAGTYAGIPVTHRDFTSSFHVITGHLKENGKLNIDFKSLVKIKGTLIFMMSVSSIEEICNGCLLAGMKKDMPAAIIENATTVIQRKFIGTLETLPNIALQNNITSPSVIIIGNVCELSEKLDWFSNRKKVIVTKGKTNNSVLAKKLKSLNCTVIEMPTIKISKLLHNNEELNISLNNIKDYSWILFTSAVAVNLFFDHLIELNIDIRKLHHLKIGVVGSETKKEILKRGLTVDYVPTDYNGVSLAKGLIKLITPTEKLLILRSKIGSEDILNTFKDNNIDFDNVAIYNTTTETESNKATIQLLKNGQIDYVTFTSSSTVKGFVDLCSTLENFNFNKINGICIGTQTANTARTYGINVFISQQSTIDSIVKKVKELITND